MAANGYAVVIVDVCAGLVLKNAQPMQHHPSAQRPARKRTWQWKLNSYPGLGGVLRLERKISGT